MKAEHYMLMRFAMAECFTSPSTAVVPGLGRALTHLERWEAQQALERAGLIEGNPPRPTADGFAELARATAEMLPDWRRMVMKSRRKRLGDRYRYEVTLDVASFAADGDRYDRHEAFELASEAHTRAEREALSEVRDALGFKRRPNRIAAATCEFVEFDSGNISHAGAHYLVEIEGLTDDEILQLDRAMLGPAGD